MPCDIGAKVRTTLTIKVFVSRSVGSTSLSVTKQFHCTLDVKSMRIEYDVAGLWLSFARSCSATGDLESLSQLNAYANIASGPPHSFSDPLPRQGTPVHALFGTLSALAADPPSCDVVPQKQCSPSNTPAVVIFER